MMDWDDGTAWSISALMWVFVAIFMFRDPIGTGFDTYPLMFKIIILVLSPPLFYMAALWQLNK